MRYYKFNTFSVFLCFKIYSLSVCLSVVLEKTEKQPKDNRNMKNEIEKCQSKTHNNKYGRRAGRQAGSKPRTSKAALSNA